MPATSSSALPIIHQQKYNVTAGKIMNTSIRATLVMLICILLSFCGALRRLSVFMPNIVKLSHTITGITCTAFKDVGFTNTTLLMPMNSNNY